MRFTMSRQALTLLLLVLAAATGIAAQPRAGTPTKYSVTIDGQPVDVNEFVGETVTFTGTLLSTGTGCPSPSGTPCVPVASATVTIQGTGVGQFLAPPTPAAVGPTAAPVNSSNTLGGDVTPRGPKAPSNIKAAGDLTSLSVTTNPQGKFTFSVTSSAAGVTNFEAKYGNDKSQKGQITWQEPVFFLVPKETNVSDTLGFNPTLSFTLYQCPLREEVCNESTPPSASSCRKAPAKTLGGNSVCPLETSTLVPDATVTFSPAGLGSGVTDKDGVVTIEVPSPLVPGTTEVVATYKNGNATTTVNWVAPVIPDIEVVNNLTSNIPVGNSTIVSVTIVDADNNPLANVPVTFNVEGPAVLVQEQQPVRKAPHALGVVDETVIIDANGQANITLTSAVPSTNLVKVSYEILGRIFYFPEFNLTWVFDEPQPLDFTAIALAPKRLLVAEGRTAELTATVTNDAGAGVEEVTLLITVTPSRDCPHIHEEAEATEAEDALEASAAAETAAVRGTELLAVTDAQGQAKFSLSGLKPGCYKVVASATNAAGTHVSSAPSYVTVFGKGHKGHDNYGHKKHHHDGYNKADRKDKEEHHGHKKKGDYDGKGSYKRSSDEY